MADKIINGSLKTTGLINSGYPVKKETIEYIELGNGTSYLDGLDDSVFNENIISGVAKSYDIYMQAQYFDVSFNFGFGKLLSGGQPVEGVYTINYLQEPSYKGYKYQFNYGDITMSSYTVTSIQYVNSDNITVTARPGINLDGDVVIYITVTSTRTGTREATLNLRIYINECTIHTVPVPLIYGSVARTQQSSLTTEPLVHYQGSFAPTMQSDTQRTYSIDIANVSAFRDCILEIESEGSSYTEQQQQMMGYSDFGTGEITSMTYSITNHTLHVNVTVTYTAGENSGNFLYNKYYIIDLVPRIHIKYIPYPSIGFTFLNNKITNSDIILSDINQFIFDPTNGASINSSDKRIEGTLYTSGLLNNGRTIKKLQFTSSDQILYEINDIPVDTILAYSSGSGSCGSVSQQAVTISDSFSGETSGFGNSGESVTTIRTLTYELATVPTNVTFTAAGTVTCTFSNKASLIENISLQSYNFSVNNSNKLILTLEISVTYRTIMVSATISYDVNANVPEIELTTDFLTPLDLYEHHRNKQIFTSVESSISFSSTGSGTASTATRAYSYTINNVGSTSNIDDITIDISGAGSLNTTYQILTNNISYDISNHSLDVYINVRFTGRRFTTITPRVNINYYPWPLNEIQLLVPGTNNKISSGFPVTCFYCGPYTGNLGN